MFFSDSAGKEFCSVGHPGSILGQDHPLEKGMATHSSVLAWTIPRTKEPGGLYIVYGVAKTWTRRSDYHFHFVFGKEDQVGKV